MAAHLLDVTVPGMAAAAAEEERQARAAERLRTQLGSVAAAGGTYGRRAEAGLHAVYALALSCVQQHRNMQQSPCRAAGFVACICMA